jgi:hypothetical protein
VFDMTRAKVDEPHITDQVNVRLVCPVPASGAAGDISLDLFG